MSLLDYAYRVKQVMPFMGYPLRRKEHYQPFFIVGSGRSGNTLLRRILEQHSDIHIPPETYVLGPSIKLFSRHSNMEWKTLVRLILSQFEYHPEFDTFETTLRPLVARLDALPKYERSLARILDSFYRYHAESMSISCSRWGDKTPLNTFYMGRIRSVFPDAKYINMVRDGVDVVASYLQAGIYKRMDDAAIRWKRSLHTVDRFRSLHPGSTMDVRYEELVSAPRETVINICRFLELDFEPAMLVVDKQVERMGDVVMREHHRNVRGPINTGSIGKGKQQFTRGELEKLRQIIGKDLGRLGYS